MIIPEIFKEIYQYREYGILIKESSGLRRDKISHFAKVTNGNVTQVIVAEPEFFDTFIDSSPGEWIQTSYNTFGGQHPEGRPLRKNFAGIGYTYDRERDAFIEPKPFASWILNNDTCLWESPTPMPTDGKIYGWDELQQQWIEQV